MFRARGVRCLVAALAVWVAAVAAVTAGAGAATAASGAAAAGRIAALAAPAAARPATATPALRPGNPAPARPAPADAAARTARAVPAGPVADRVPGPGAGRPDAAWAAGSGRGPGCVPGGPHRPQGPAGPVRGEQGHVPVGRPAVEQVWGSRTLPVRVLVRGPDQPAPGPVELSVMRV